ncbi:MAG: polyisoprenoid-binding protein [Betaproteobacteria bacterium]|nr:polyisoprenoid-binding protein [Betaproteobacteria bacterium]
MKKFLLLAATLAATGAAHAQSASYTIDPTHTFVTFEVTHFGTSTNRGRFDRKSGSISFDRAARAGKVDISIETASVNTGTAPFDKHLQSKDFFDSEAHPTVRFVGEQFSFDGDRVSEVAGTLTLLSKTQPVTLKAVRFNCFNHPRLKREVCGGDFETTIQRSQWGMGYGIPAIPDAVKLVIQVEAVRQ